MSILIEQLHGHWSACESAAPGTAFGGATPGEALDRLLATLPQDGQPLHITQHDRQSCACRDADAQRRNSLES